MMEMRKIKKLVKDKFVKCEMEDIKAGDVFRLWEANGEVIMSPTGTPYFMAATDAFIDSDGMWAVEIFIVE